MSVTEREERQEECGEKEYLKQKKVIEKDKENGRVEDNNQNQMIQKKKDVQSDKFVV